MFLSDQVSCKKFTEEYSCDMPQTFLNGESLNAELDLWALTMSKPYDDVQITLKNTSEDLFPQLHHLLRLVCTFPIITCENERSVSALRRLKTYLWSTMGQERLSSIALIHCNYSMDINYEEVIVRFYALNPHRVSMKTCSKTSIIVRHQFFFLIHCHISL